MLVCVVCGACNISGRTMTCSKECHDELVKSLIATYGEFKKVVRAGTGEAFKVPTRDILEHGVNESELDKYPKWVD